MKILKLKTFWAALLAIATGTTIWVLGQPTAGANLIAQGILALGIRTAISPPPRTHRPPKIALSCNDEPRQDIPPP